jgi:cation transport ATPase
VTASGRFFRRGCQDALSFALLAIATGVLSPAFRILLNPMMAALAMFLNSVSVIASALRLPSLSFST